MIFQEFNIFQALAVIVGAILSFFSPIIAPIGEYMVLWINVLLPFFPADDLTIYFVIFIVLIISGAIINGKFPSDKPKAQFEKRVEKRDDSVKKCKDCGNPIGSAKECPYCSKTVDKSD